MGKQKQLYCIVATNKFLDIRVEVSPPSTSRDLLKDLLNRKWNQSWKFTFAYPRIVKYSKIK